MILVSMPYAPASAPYVAEAALSVLNQTYEAVRLVVVNDGGPPEAWEPLADVDDDRLVRFDLPTNSGRYYCDAISVEQVRRDPDKWRAFTIHDADDVSGPNRLANMVASATDDTEMVLAGFTIRAANGRETVRRPRPAGVLRPGARVAHVAHHTALWRPGALEVVRPNADWRVAFDTLLIALAVRHLRVAVSDDVSYLHRLHPEQLTRDPAWGMRGRERTLAWRRRERLWRAATDREAASKACTPEPETQAEVAKHADRLGALL